MATVLFWLAAGTLAIYLASAVEIFFGFRRIRHLRETVPPLARKLPSVSILVAARNEERNLQEALASLLKQDHPQLEFIVVDDRSTDRTGEILDAMALEDPRLRVVHLKELPAGWLGKNHALHAAAAQATGDLLLFTDADVVMEPSTVRRAAARVEDGGADHLVISPSMLTKSVLLEAAVAGFFFFFTFFFRQWRVMNPKSRAHIGIGAFNLLRASVYRAIGGHEAIRLRPDDDVKLGKLVKMKGYRQEIVEGTGFIAVEWYRTVGELVRGLEKNMFAGLEYNLALAAASTVVILVACIWPFAGALVTHGWTQLLNAATAATIFAILFCALPRSGLRRRAGLAFPLAALLFLFIKWRAIALTYLRHGIEWRGTRYSLKELRSNRV